MDTYDRAGVNRFFYADELFVTASDAKQIEEERDALKAENIKLAIWKEATMDVDKTWDPQAVAAELGIGLGQSIRENILPGIKKLKAELAEYRLIPQTIYRWLRMPISSDTGYWPRYATRAEA